MNINPLTNDQRDYAINRLAEGLGPRAKDDMHWFLSDGHVRSCYEGVFGEEIPKAETFNVQRSTSNAQPTEVAA